MKTEAIIFSVIVPTFNRSNALYKCLESLASQTFSKFEVIVCDDGSTDNTVEVVSHFKSKLRIKYLFEQNWGGPARPRNNGVREAEGAWLAFLDSDDYWDSRKLEIIVEYTKRADLIYHKMRIVDMNGKHFSTIGSKLKSGFSFPGLLVDGNLIPLSSVVCKKKLVQELGGFDENRKLIAVEDYDLWIRLSQLKCNVCFVSKQLGYYRLGDDNLSAGVKQLRKLRAVYLKHLNHVNQKDKKIILQAYLYQKIKICMSTRKYHILSKEIILLPLIKQLKIIALRIKFMCKKQIQS